MQTLMLMCYFSSVERLVSLTIYLVLELVSCLFLQILGLRFGLIGIFCLAFLFLPVARGSILLRFIDIPFEHATKYHVWLGHLTMLLFTIHGLLYIVAWTIEGRLLSEVSANAVHLIIFVVDRPLAVKIRG